MTACRSQSHSRPGDVGTDEATIQRVVEAMRAWTSGASDVRGLFWVIEGGKRVESFANPDDAYADAKRRNAVSVLAALTPSALSGDAGEGEAASDMTALREENARLREHIAASANNINIVGSAYDEAIAALDRLVSETKSSARAALTGGAQ